MRRAGKMVVDELLAKAREYIPEERISVIDEAYRFAEKAHHGQLRLSGEPLLITPYKRLSSWQN